MSDPDAAAARQTDEQHGVVFPRAADGRRSTAAVGRAVVADALRLVDPAGARAAEQETSWRSDYLVHFRRLVEAALGSADDAVSIARAGLDGLLTRMAVREGDRDLALSDWQAEGSSPETARVRGAAEAETELALPYRGKLLRGDDIRRVVDGWVGAGVVEESVADAIGAVLANPDWLRLDGRLVAVLGAGAEMGPLGPLLSWGARVAAVDLRRPAIWTRVLDSARRGAGELILPAESSTPDPGRAGADLLAEAPRIAQWLASVAGDDRLVIGNYVYADGATNVRVSVAVDVLSIRLTADRPDTALAFLATPTDVFAVPGDAVRQSVAAYEGRSRSAKILGRPLRTFSGGRLLRRKDIPGRVLRARVEVADDLADERERVLVGGRVVVGHAGEPRVDVGATKLLGGHVLAGRGFHERWAADEDRPGALDDDRLVAHRGDIRAARGAGAHHRGDLRDPGGGHPRLVEEDSAEVVAVGEDLRLEREERPARIDQVEARQTVLLGDLLRAQVLLHRQREIRSAFHGRVVGDDHALAALDDPDPCDDPRGRRLAVVQLPGRQRRKLQERRVRVDEQVDPLARG